MGCDVTGDEFLVRMLCEWKARFDLGEEPALERELLQLLRNAYAAGSERCTRYARVIVMVSTMHPELLDDFAKFELMSDEQVERAWRTHVPKDGIS